MIYELIGQETIAKRFSGLISSGRIGSAYLFSGADGSGKTAMALNLAAALLCQDPQNGEACGKCASCQKMITMNHSDLHFIHAMPKAKTASATDPFVGLKEEDYQIIREERVKLSQDPYSGINIPGAKHILISQMRHIKKELSMKPSEGGRQVVLILEAQMANEQAFNSLLKVLEEPPPKTTFILTTSSLELLLPTIRSRCQNVKFNPVPDLILVEYLGLQGLDDSNAQRVARLSGGNVRQAKLLMKADFSKVDTTILDFWRIMMAGNINGRSTSLADVAKLIEDYTKMAKEDPTAFTNLLRFMIFWLRDAQLLEASGNADQIINSHLIKEMSAFVEYYPTFPYYETIRKTENIIRDVKLNMYVPALLAELFLEMRYQLRKNKKAKNAT
ncbi:MAG: DNA polymerase III subunit delta' [Candidatus Neomarinimicrobiota bacterium]